MESAAVAAAPAVTAVDVPWGAVWGQDEAVATLRAAASDPEAMTHAWLITGPPGSGRSTLAYAFAAALIAEEGDEQTMRQVLAGTHPDMTALRTEGVIISIKDARALVERSYFGPSLGRHRVIVMEDADRMVERTSNVLLKALEEPPERTVWVLCAPSDADLLPTIRSRVRTLRLREPDIADVARLISQRTGIDLADRRTVRAARPASHRHGAASRDGCRGPHSPRRDAARRSRRARRRRCGRGRGPRRAGRDRGREGAHRRTRQRRAGRSAAHARHRRGRCRAARGPLAAQCPRRRAEAPRDAQPARRHRPRADGSAVDVPRRRDAPVRRGTPATATSSTASSNRSCVPSPPRGRRRARSSSSIRSPRRDATSNRTSHPPSPSKACS